jgi:hypothetical protein
MTSKVTITAHCGPDKEVVGAVFDLIDGEPQIIETFEVQDGETVEKLVYDGRQVSVQEVLKEGVQ